MNESVKDAAARVRAEMRLDTPIDRTVHLWSGDTTGGLTYCGESALNRTTSMVHLTETRYTVHPNYDADAGFARCADCQAVLEKLLADVRDNPPAK